VGWRRAKRNPSFVDDSSTILRFIAKLWWVSP
ncbi:MAG: hypothetical protein ACI8WB_004693, partial [Phenylobacterium sp.]